MKKQKIFLVILFLVLFACSIVPIFIFNDSAAITKYSIPAFVYMVCCVIYAIIAYSLRKRGNLFLIAGDKLFFIFLRMFSKDKNYTKQPYYKKEFFISGVIFCSVIPFYIPIAFFAHDFYSAMQWPLRLSLFLVITLMIVTILLRTMNLVKTKKNEKNEDDRFRKEQEQRESMGKWK